jgi:hypothetical protein
MVLINKKASFMMKWGLKIVLLLLIIVLASMIGCKFIKNIVGASPKDQSIAQFNTFVAQIESLSYVKNSYTSSYIQLGLNEKYYVVGFSDKRNSEINKEHDIIKKPRQCDSKGSCFCLYQKKPNPKKARANVLACRTIENIDYAVANKLFVETLKKTSDQTDNFLQDGVNFVGSTITNDHFTYANERNYLSDYISSFIDKNVYGSTYSQTYNLGFYEDNKDLYYFALTSSKLQIVQLYVELINYEGTSSLLFFPYNRAFFNREYFLISRQGVDDCNEKFVNAVIKKDDGTLKYCVKDGDGLVESEDIIQACLTGEVREMCACGPSVIRNGFCLINPSKFPENRLRTVTALPLDYCDSNFGACGYYYDEFACDYDACNTGLICGWNTTDPDNPKCKSGCTFAKQPCEFYDIIRCDKDYCNFGEFGCKWDTTTHKCVDREPTGIDALPLDEQERFRQPSQENLILIGEG